ncbi:class E sortase [Gleimia sp. 6138-11-ORH1]|uniref:class E sortase n=1 Tax=Gleimia sp. 6138-11-ORH1 TaxID=2973937 RepID=UPI002168FF65|nr:class E sortase [Gleimia sp. 6138-11-ORH1]MCS4485115.1 class E sortase [Gleimia sp. 6138-11-ORH1]
MEARHARHEKPRHAKPIEEQEKPKTPLFAALIGVVGEVLITISLVLGLFVFWQVVWTSWEVNRQLDQAVSQFDKALKPLPKQGNKLKIGEPRTDAPPVAKVDANGAPLGKLHVPRWNAIVPMAEGVGLDVINQGYAGHYPTTQALGEVGNFALAAHRLSYGNAFQYVHDLQVGDRIVAETSDAFFVYEVSSWEIVEPTQVEVLEPVPNQVGIQPTERLMTLTTCDPIWGNSHRYIVYTKYVHWVPRESGIPQELANTLKG